MLDSGNGYMMNSKIQYDIFNHSDIEKVVVGKNGWLFYSGENNIKIATEEYPDFDEGELKDICQKQIETQQRLAEQGIEYVLILPPSKVSIYPEYLKGNFAVTRTPVDILADYLEEHSDIKVIRLKTALLKEKEYSDSLLYFKTDSHWNAYGYYIAYNALVDKLNEWHINESTSAEVDFAEEAYMHDLTGMLVESNEKYYENNISDCRILNATATQITTGEMYDKVQKYISDKAIRHGTYYENSNRDLGSFIVFGDSMFMNRLERLMAENCSNLTCIWSYNITQEAINLFTPDVVFMEVTERNLNKLGSYRHELITTAFTMTDGNILDIVCNDFGQYDKMWCPVWSEENGQDDLIWYEAERLDDSTWHIAVDLNKHHTNGIYNIHFYQGSIAKEEAKYALSVTYDVGSLFN